MHGDVTRIEQFASNSNSTRPMLDSKPNELSMILFISISSRYIYIEIFVPVWNKYCWGELISFNHVCRFDLLQYRTCKLISEVDPSNTPPMYRSVKIKPITLKRSIFVIVNAPYDLDHGVFIGDGNVTSYVGHYSYW